MDVPVNLTFEKCSFYLRKYPKMSTNQKSQGDKFIIVFIVSVICLLASTPFLMMYSGDKWNKWKAEMEAMDCDELKSHFTEDDINDYQETEIMKQLIRLEC